MYALLSSHLKKRRTPYHVPGQDFFQFSHSASPSRTQCFSFSVRSFQGVSRNAALLGVLVEVALAFLEACGLPRPDAAASQRQRFVRNDQSEVDADNAPEAAAGVAGTER